MDFRKRALAVTAVLALIALVMASSGSAERLQDQPAGRVTFTRVTSNSDKYIASVVKDSASGGCWLMVSPAGINAAVSLAPAPAAACK